MNDREIARYDMFGRVVTFGTDYASDFLPGSAALVHFANLAAILRDLDLAKAGQLHGGVTAKTVLLDALRIDIQNIGRTARAIAQDEPGFADGFPAVASASQHHLLTTADAYLRELAKPGVAAKFIAHEMPVDFVADLTADRSSVESAADEIEGDALGGVENTAAVGRLVKAGIKEVNYLNAIAHNKYSRNADRLRAWKSASHTERAPERAKKPAATQDGSASPAA